MLESEAEWVNLIEEEMFNQEYHVPPPLPIVAIKVKGDFVVQVKASVSVGFKFEYMNAKRYVYHINVFAGQISNDVIDIQEETYEFTFYAMGHLGIKAGVELEVHIGIISADVASIGFTAEAGVYAKLWGYFYYELKYTASNGREQNYSGALLIEIGAYLQVDFKLSAVGGLATKELNLVDKEWPFWSVGKEDCIQDFATPQEEMPEVALKQYIRSTVLSDDLFKMEYLDMKGGDMEQAVYSDEERFIISIDNEAFSYDATTNTLSVTPEEGSKKEEGTMTITWIAYPLAFTSKPIQREISLYWDNLRDGYVIVPYTNGGSYIPLINQRYESVVKVPADPEKTGYVFSGWYTDEELTSSYTWPELMPNVDTTIYAKWEPSTDTPYVVEHYQQILGTPDYELVLREELTGTTDYVVTPEAPYYTGFVTPAQEEVQILADGSAVQRYYYDLQTHTVTFEPGIVGGETVSYELDFGGRVTAPQFAAKGYIFTGWDKEIAPTMGEQDVVYTAQWKKDPATSYRVEYYVQQPDGRYTMQDFTVYNGTTGDVLTEQMLRKGATLPNGNGELVNADALYTVENGISFRNITVYGEDLTAKGEDPVIAANGKTIIKVNYQRETYELTFQLENGAEDLSYSVYYGAAISLPENIRRQGYALTGWVPEFVDSMPAKNVSYTAQWQANDYEIAFDANGGEGVMGNQAAVYDVPAAIFTNEFTRTGYDFAGWSVLRNGTIRYQDKEEAANLGTEKGQTVTLYASWKPVEYEITYHDALSHSNPAGYTIESSTIVFRAPADKEGYTFTGWFDNAEFDGEPVTQIPAGSYGNVEFFAGYVPNKHTIVYHGNGNTGGEMAAQELTYDVQADLNANAFVRTGYTFKGWARTAEGTVSYIDEEAVKNLEAQDGKVLNFYAVWEMDTYTITYELSGGSNASGNPTAYTVLDSIVFSEPSRVGYSFGGWYDEAGKQVTDVAVGSTGNITLTAKWIANKNTPYVVEHYKRDLNSNSYTLVERETFVGTTDAAIAPDVNSYEGFSSPNAQNVTITPDGSLVVRYNYDRITYSLTLQYRDGVTQSKTITKQYADVIELPVPQREGYGFAGWYFEEDCSGTAVTTHNMPAVGTDGSNTANLYAKWNAGEYSYSVLHYTQKLDGSYELAETVAGTALMDSEVTPQRKNYEGFTAPEQAGDILITSNAAENVEEYYYTRNQYSLTWELSGGSASGDYTSGTVSYGAPITVPVPVKVGYTGRWDASPALTMPDNDLSYTMFWTANEYTVDLNSDGTVIGSIKVTYDQTYGALPTPERSGYDFGGWFTQSEGKGDQVTSATTLTTANDHTLYAYWTIKRYTIDYNLAGGTNSAKNPASYTTEQLVVLKAPTKTGYSFLGWTWAGQTEPMTDVILDGASGDKSYTANWQINSYKAVFYREDGSLIAEQVYEYGATIKAPNPGEKEGFVFAGWGATVPATMPANDLSFVSQWSRETYDIFYELNGGTNHVDNKTHYTHEDEDISFGEPTRVGHTFAGWYTDAEFTQPITAIPHHSVGSITLYAKWEANTYTVKMHLNNNTAEILSQDFTYGVTQALTRHKATYTGYSFVGWATEANGDAIYTNGAKLKDLTAEPGGTVHLYGIWETVTYTVSYQNLFEAANDSRNPTTFDVENNTLVIVEPTGARVGYNFAGWYADEMLTIPITGSYTINGAYNISIYAKWNANPYSVTFNNNLRDGSPTGTATQLMVYGSNTNLKPFKEMNFSYKGHTFLGWHTDQNATEPLYTDGQLVSSLTPSGDITLYAIWGVNQYTLSYAIGVGASKHSNPTEYNVWTDDITLQAPTDIKAGYQFLGWFDDAGNKVTTIVKSSIGDRGYTAKWAHAGVFTLSNNGTTFTITRTLPEGTQATANPQQVYYRTVNGTAIGGTADVKHFKHVGGENVYATFNQGDMVKTFTVQEGTSNLGDNLPDSYTSGVNRYYHVELYKVIDTVNPIYAGTLGSNKSIKRTISQNSNYKMTASALFAEYTDIDIIPNGSDETIKDDGWGNDKTFNPMSKFTNSYRNSYAALANLSLAMHIDMWASEKNDGYQHVKLVNNANGSVLDEVKFALLPGDKTGDWLHVQLPMTGTQGNVGCENASDSTPVTIGGVQYMKMGRLTSVTMKFDASGDFEDTWYAGHTKYRVRMIDTAEPQQLGMGYMALCKYKTGDKITITVRFNEIVNSASNVSVGSISGIKANNWQYVDGYGTNTLTFTGTVTGDFEITTTVNNSLANIKPLSGSFYDMY